MTAATITMPSVMFGSPRDWDKFFWRTYHEAFLEILHRACDPVGQETYLSREIARRGLSRSRSDSFQIG